MPKKNTLFAACLQFDVKLGDIEANYAQVEEGLAALRPESPGIVVLPELWATGFAYSRLGEMVGHTTAVLDRLRKLAGRYNIYLAGSLPETDQVHYYNTLYVTGPEGVVGSYRKQHLFAPMGENGYFSPGDRYGTLDTPVGRIAALVCYDLRFPELVRNQAAEGAELLVISAQWPIARKEHWRILIQARAIENQLFVIAANRCGTDQSGDRLTFAGHSMIVAPDGTILQEAGQEKASISRSIDMSQISTVRNRFNTAVPSR